MSSGICPGCRRVYICKWYRFYNLTIRATNMASVSATSSAIIHILDRNDNAPYFTQQLYKGEISESAPIASLILAVNDTLKMDQRYVSNSTARDIAHFAGVKDQCVMNYYHYLHTMILMCENAL